jgi:hypothetical protein
MWKVQECFSTAEQINFGALLSLRDASRIGWKLRRGGRTVPNRAARGNMFEISCQEVRRELSNYIEEDVGPTLRAQIEAHVEACGGCRAVYDGVRNILRLVGGGEVLELPQGFSKRLLERIRTSSLPN